MLKTGGAIAPPCPPRNPPLDIQERLQQQGKSFADFPGMPIPRNIRNRYEEPRVIQDELDLCPSDECGVCMTMCISSMPIN